MQIEILHFSNVLRADNLIVVIDVFRAFSTACYMAAAGADRILTVAGWREALSLAQHYSQAILVGERGGRRIPGFALGNSPTAVLKAAWAGRPVILTTSNGTQGLAAARHAAEVVTGSFVNAGAVAAYIRQCDPARISLVCMGSGGRPALEDTLCAEYLRDLLKGPAPAFETMRTEILNSAGALRFRQAQSGDMPPEDLALCLALDRFDFVLRLENDAAGVMALQRITPDRSRRPAGRVSR